MKADGPPRPLIREGVQTPAAFVLFLVGWFAWVPFSGEVPQEPELFAWLIFGALTAIAFPIGYASARLFWLVGPAPCAGLVAASFIDEPGNLWPIALAGVPFILAPAIGLSFIGRRLWLRRHGRKCEPGRYPNCGYDLRAGRIRAGCPECGWNRPEDQA